MDVLQRIKRLMARRRYRFTYKALRELHVDALDPEDALESVLNAQTIKKTVRSRGVGRTGSREKLYVIESFNYRDAHLHERQICA